MKVLIEIPNTLYERYKELGATGQILTVTENAICNGQPLPKGHGDLKDVNMFKASVIRAEHNADGTSALFDATDICRMLDSVPAIIEADKEGDEE